MEQVFRVHQLFMFAYSAEPWRRRGDERTALPVGVRPECWMPTTTIELAIKLCLQSALMQPRRTDIWRSLAKIGQLLRRCPVGLVDTATRREIGRKRV